MEADPKLLSLLEKINNPIDQLNIVLTVEVFSYLVEGCVRVP